MGIEPNVGWSEALLALAMSHLIVGANPSRSQRLVPSPDWRPPRWIDESISSPVRAGQETFSGTRYE